MNVMFSGGGTAGHINPAIAIAGNFRKKYPDCNIGFIGRENGSENELVKKAKIQLFTIPISGLSRSLTFKNFSKIKEAFTARKLAADILKDFRADVVIGTGGYVCWPVISAAADLEIPAVIHESNAAFGLTTKLLAKKCDLLLLGTDTKKTKYKNSIYTGNPVRADFAAVTRNQARQKLKIPDGKLLILSVGGSIGAKKLNDVRVETMKKYSAKTVLLENGRTLRRQLNDDRNDDQYGNGDQKEDRKQGNGDVKRTLDEKLDLSHELYDLL